MDYYGLQSQKGVWVLNYAHNLAMLAKRAWRLITNPSFVLSRLLKAIYFPDSSFWDAMVGEAPSYAWRSILAARRVLQSGYL